MDLQIKKTADGSQTLYREDIDETYHSTHGAWQEAWHVFIDKGITHFENQEEIVVFEMGLGTALNAIITFDWAQKNNKKVRYYAIEKFPIPVEICMQLNYQEFLKSKDLMDVWKQMHQLAWDETHTLHPAFTFTKIHLDIFDFEAFEWDIKYAADIVYFDAFGPRAQSEMWDLPVLEKMWDVLKEKGMLVTYCAQGQFKRNLKSIGFRVENTDGPPGKREMTLGFKG